jgi:hypothetical protein
VELVTMISWVFAAGVSLLLGHGVLMGRLSVGVAAFAGLAGASLSILYVVLQGPAGLAWGAVGSALVGILAPSVAAVGLTSATGAVSRER